MFSGNDFYVFFSRSNSFYHLAVAILFCLYIFSATFSRGGANEQEHFY